MTAREGAVLVGMCIVWGLHFLVIKAALDVMAPLTYAALRMSLVAALMSPFLRWRRGAMVPVLIGGACLGAANYAFLFTGLNYATVSTAAVAVELYTPFATILSVAVLGERVGTARIVGIMLALAGVFVIATAGGGGASPETRIGLGVGLVAAGAFCEALGALAVKRATAFDPMGLLAWFALIGAVLLWPLAAVLEGDVATAVAGADYRVIGPALVYSAVGASIFGHTAYYWLLKRLPLSQVAPSALLATLIGVAGGVVILRDPAGPQFYAGGAMTLIGVAIIMMRSHPRVYADVTLAEPTPPPRSLVEEGEADATAPVAGAPVT